MDKDKCDGLVNLSRISLPVLHIESAIIYPSYAAVVKIFIGDELVSRLVHDY